MPPAPGPGERWRERCDTPGSVTTPCPPAETTRLPPAPQDAQPPRPALPAPLPAPLFPSTAQPRGRPDGLHRVPRLALPRPTQGGGFLPSGTAQLPRGCREQGGRVAARGSLSPSQAGVSWPRPRQGDPGGSQWAARERAAGEAGAEGAGASSWVSAGTGGGEEPWAEAVFSGWSSGRGLCGARTSRRGERTHLAPAAPG